MGGRQPGQVTEFYGEKAQEKFCGHPASRPPGGARPGLPAAGAAKDDFLGNFSDPGPQTSRPRLVFHGQRAEAVLPKGAEVRGLKRGS